MVKIPNGALRFKPDIADRDRAALYAKYGVQDASTAAPASRVAAAPASDATAGGAANAAAAGAQGGTGGGGNGAGGRRGQGGSSGARRQDSAIVWKLLPDKALQPVQVSLGVTDFTFTEQVSGNLSQGDDLVIGQSANKSSTSAAAARNPVSGTGGATQGVPRRF